MTTTQLPRMSGLKQGQTLFWLTTPCGLTTRLFAKPLPQLCHDDEYIPAQADPEHTYQNKLAGAGTASGTAAAVIRARRHPHRFMVSGGCGPTTEKSCHGLLPLPDHVVTVHLMCSVTDVGRMPLAWPPAEVYCLVADPEHSLAPVRAR